MVPGDGNPPAAEEGPAGGMAPAGSPGAWFEREVGAIREGRRDAWAHRRGEPRVFAALWALYLFACAIASLGASGMAGEGSAEVYRPTARVMLVLVGLGVGVLWPMLRLSQQSPEHPRRAAAADLAVVVLPMQVLVWTQALPWMSGWSLGVVAAAGAHMTAWAVLIGGVLSFFYRIDSGGTPRWPLMSALVALSVGGPVLGVLWRGLTAGEAGLDAWLMASPVTGALEITRPRPWTGSPAGVGGAHWAVIGITAWVGVVPWITPARGLADRGRGA